MGRDSHRPAPCFSGTSWKNSKRTGHLGYLMGWAYLANVDLSEGDLRPNAPCPCALAENGYLREKLVCT
jgi:hypothetical protein